MHIAAYLEIHMYCCINMYSYAYSCIKKKRKNRTQETKRAYYILYIMYIDIRYLLYYILCILHLLNILCWCSRIVDSAK